MKNENCKWFKLKQRHCNCRKNTNPKQPFCDAFGKFQFNCEGCKRFTEKNDK